MAEKRLSQEGLKCIACGSMLLDHIGAMMAPLRGGGRTSILDQQLSEVYICEKA